MVIEYETQKKFEISRTSHVSSEITTMDVQAAYSRETHNVERNMSPVWKYVRE